MPIQSKGGIGGQNSYVVTISVAVKMNHDQRLHPMLALKTLNSFTITV